MRGSSWPTAASAVVLVAAIAFSGGKAGHAQSAPNGMAIFAQRCAACHSVAKGANGAGPSLAGVVGRKAASVPGFSYSAALVKSGIVWSPAQLDQYLASPQKAVPGTRMPVSVNDGFQRKALIDFLASKR